MSTAIATIPQSVQWDDKELVKAIKETVCKGATDAQFRMFAEVCKATGLNPWLKEIWFVPNVGVMAGRDGYLRVANDHPMFDGMETRVERDDKGIPVKAVCSVWRKDRAHPIICEAYFDEYRKGSQVWQTYKSAMIGKVAEVLALKRSFSINGVVTEEEVGSESERGSKEAQQSVAQERIKELSAPKVEAATIQMPEDPTYEQRHEALILEANAALDAPGDEKAASKPGAAPKSIMSFEALKEWGYLKEELRKLSGADTIYYAALKAKGYDHANKIANKKDAADIWKVLATERTRMKGEADLKATLTESRERIGGVKFIEILGANGCETVTEALRLGGTPLSALLAELKQAVDDLQPQSA